MTDVTRRGFLRQAGLVSGSVVVVAAGGLSYRAYDDGVFAAGEGAAYAAWGDWEQGQGPLALVAAAILAANPHDLQPWVFHVTASRIEVFADPARRLGSIDPYGRELRVGLGCALENLMRAAPAHGYRARLALLPDAGNAVHAARVDLTRGPTLRDGLYEAIPHRHTDRSPDSGRHVDAGVLGRMGALAGGLPGAGVHWVTEPKVLGELMVEAAVAITQDEQQSRDGFAFFRSSWDEVQKHKDGLTLDAQGLSAFTTAMAKLLPASSRSSGDAFWVKRTRDTHTATAAAYGIVTVADAHDAELQLTGGRLLERIHLWATANGIALQHMNQITERADRERQLGLQPHFGPALARLLPAGAEPLVSFRVGYAEGTDGRRFSPRRPVDEVVRRLTGA